MCDPLLYVDGAGAVYFVVVVVGGYVKGKTFETHYKSLPIVKKGKYLMLVPATQ